MPDKIGDTRQIGTQALVRLELGLAVADGLGASGSQLLGLRGLACQSLCWAF